MEKDTNNKIKKCRVCGDPVSVFYNYSGLSCKSCKKFFFRSVTNKPTYFCRKNENCPIDMSTRRKCQKCRLQKCLDIGMKQELVILNQNSTEKLPFGVDKNKIPNQIVYQYKLNSYELSQLHEIKIASTMIEFPQNARIVGRITTLQDTVQHDVYFARRFVKFCKNISDFKMLPRDDQVILIKEVYLEACTINSAFYMDFERGHIPIAGNLSGDRIYLLDTGLIKSEMKSNSLGVHYHQFLKSLKRKMNSDAIIQNLIYMQLLFKSRANIRCHELVRYNRKRYEYLLNRYLEHKHGEISKANTIWQSITNLMNQFDVSVESLKRMVQLEIPKNESVSDILAEVLDM